MLDKVSEEYICIDDTAIKFKVSNQIIKKKDKDKNIWNGL